MKYTYMLSAAYCQSWTIKDAIREVIANAMSTHDKIIVEWRNGKGYVQNSNRTLEIRHLLIGESDNRDDNKAIGTFGEGLKLAGLVFCRDKRQYSITANGTNFLFTLDYIEDFERNILAVAVQPSSNSTKGTIVEFECTKDELDEAQKLFRVLSPVKEYCDTKYGTILKDERQIYVLGVHIGEQNTLFGYDLKDKTLINRDRNIVNAIDVTQAIENVLESCEDERVIDELLQAAIRKDKVMECELTMIPNYGKPKEVWQKVIDGYGKATVTCGNPDIDARAQYLGFKVLDFGRLNFAVRHSTNIKETKEIQPETTNKSIDAGNLTKQERKNLNRAIKFYRNAARCPICEVIVTEDLPKDTLSQRNGKKVTLNRFILNDFSKVFMTLCHEGAHIMSGASDCSALFEAAQDEIIQNIAKTTFMPKRDKAYI